ncbi:hypothetical protein CCHOA_07980 [Corynebacterium choanae]|uniref:Uncharacterized protein n=1 Tax=Corynebacterium choanae TaxID=1862358 RepID=A0A3G6JAN9_9CORY|nr:hypothetical protein CCHOA_07980 [Corynebacterium choanae]
MGGLRGGGDTAAQGAHSYHRSGVASGGVWGDGCAGVGCHCVVVDEAPNGCLHRVGATVGGLVFIYAAKSVRV